MDSNDRRNKIKDILHKADAAVSAGRLASELGVSRQIIVGDVALLRASGCDIDATPRGYIMRESSQPAAKRSRIVSRHSDDRTEEELNICVDNGCKVVDVIVEHPVYGQLTGMLDISSRYDVKNFIRKVREADAHSLCELTDGLHIHTIEYTDDEAFRRMKEELAEAGFIYDESYL